MSDPASLEALAERVEAYNPRVSLDNRADEMPLDLAIAKAVGVADADWQVARGSVTGYFSGDGVGGFGNPTVLHYTRSVDDARTLIEADWLFTARTVWDGAEKAGLAVVSRYEVDSKHRRYWMDEHQGLAATPALALVAASLRARAATLTSEADRG